MAGLLSLRLFVRIAWAAGLVAFAILLVSIDPFLGGAPTTGVTEPVTRSLKGDRLPVFDTSVFEIVRTRPYSSRTPVRLLTQEQMPVGCDPAFSPVAAPSLANVYGRCMV